MDVVLRSLILVMLACSILTSNASRGGDGPRVESTSWRPSPNKAEIRGEPSFTTCTSSAWLFANCTGNENVPPAYSSSQTLPQINLAKDRSGWETWEYTVSYPFNRSFFLMRWEQGDSAESTSAGTSSELPVASFELFGTFGNGTSFYHNITGLNLDVKDEPGIKQIAVGVNTLTWDDSLEWYNISINLAGYIFDLQAQALPAIPFAPVVDNVSGQLVDGLYSTIVLPRAHVDGLVTFPSGESWIVQSITTLKHSWALQPLQDLVEGYTRGSSWIGNGNPVPLNVNWITAVDVSGQTTSAASMSNAIPAILYYQETDDLTIFQGTHTHSPDANDTYTTNFVIAGCAATENEPFYWNTTSVYEYGAHTDNAGGITSFYLMTVDAIYPLQGLGFQAADQVSGITGGDAGSSGNALLSPLIVGFGLLEVYRGPKN